MDKDDHVMDGAKLRRDPTYRQLFGVVTKYEEWDAIQRVDETATCVAEQNAYRKRYIDALIDLVWMESFDERDLNGPAHLRLRDIITAILQDFKND